MFSKWIRQRINNRGILTLNNLILSNDNRRSFNPASQTVFLLNGSSIEECFTGRGPLFKIHTKLRPRSDLGLACFWNRQSLIRNNKTNTYGLKIFQLQQSYIGTFHNLCRGRREALIILLLFASGFGIPSLMSVSWFLGQLVDIRIQVMIQWTVIKLIGSCINADLKQI